MNARNRPSQFILPPPRSPISSSKDYQFGDKDSNLDSLVQGQTFCRLNYPQKKKSSPHGKEPTPNLLIRTLTSRADCLLHFVNGPCLSLAGDTSITRRLSCRAPHQFQYGG